MRRKQREILSDILELRRDLRRVEPGKLEKSLRRELTRRLVELAELREMQCEFEMAWSA